MVRFGGVEAMLQSHVIIVSVCVTSVYSCKAAMHTTLGNTRWFYASLGHVGKAQFLEFFKPNTHVRFLMWAAFSQKIIASGAQVLIIFQYSTWVLQILTLSRLIIFSVLFSFGVGSYALGEGDDPPSPDVGLTTEVVTTSDTGGSGIFHASPISELSKISGTKVNILQTIR